MTMHTLTNVPAMLAVLMMSPVPLLLMFFSATNGA
jgi:hypothetical protein